MINFEEAKKFFIFNLIGSLIVAALVAVATVLLGSFGEISARVMFTLLSVTFHSLVSLAFLWNDEKQNTFENLSFFTNTLFIVIVISFLTSIFGIWGILDTEVWDIYQTCGVLLFAALHSNILSKALDKEKYLNIIIYLNYIFIAIVVLMLIPVIFIRTAINTLGEIFFRFLAAAAIIDGTLSILTIIFYKMYIHKNPKVEDQLQPQQDKRRGGLSVWVWIVIIYLLFQALLSMLLNFL
jgi:hypothetical protein